MGALLQVLKKYEQRVNYHIVDVKVGQLQHRCSAGQLPAEGTHGHSRTQQALAPGRRSSQPREQGPSVDTGTVQFSKDAGDPGEGHLTWEVTEASWRFLCGLNPSGQGGKGIPGDGQGVQRQRLQLVGHRRLRSMRLKC